MRQYSPAEAGVAIDIDRDLDRGADARIVVGIVAHVGLAGVGLRQQAADRGIAAGQTAVLDDADRVLASATITATRAAVPA